MSASKYVYLEDCDVIKVTDKAALVVYDDEQIWLPLSQMSDPEDLVQGETGVTIGITEWIANEKGIEVD